MNNQAALERVNKLDDHSNATLTPEEIANYDARFQRELASFTKVIRQLFDEALGDPRHNVQFAQKQFRSTIILAIAATAASMSTRMYLSLDRRRALEKRVEALESSFKVEQRSRDRSGAK